jgi:hypothetical protein
MIFILKNTVDMKNMGKDKEIYLLNILQDHHLSLQQEYHMRLLNQKIFKFLHSMYKFQLSHKKVKNY